MPVARYLILNNGLKMPSVGFGTYLLKGEQLQTALDFALFQGYRSIDTAHSYGNETDIGQVIKDRVKGGNLKRKDLFITTKIAKTHMRRADVRSSFQESLHSLETNYVDCVLIHHPWSFVNTGPGGEAKFDNVDILETWAALQDIYSERLAKSLGVSNFTVRQMERVLEESTKSPLSVVQTECHAYLSQYNLRQFCDSNNISVTAYSPLGAPGRQESLKSGQDSSLLDDLIVGEIAQRIKKTPAQVLLNFLLKRGMAVIPKSSTKERLKENFDCVTFELSQQDVESISRLDRGLKYFKFLDRVGHSEYFASEEF